MSSKTIAKNSMWSGVDLVFNILFALGGSVLVARAMGPEKLGRYNYILFIANITGAFATFGIPAATGKYAAEFIGRGEVANARLIIRLTARIQLALGLLLVGSWLLWIHFNMKSGEAAYTAVAVISILPFMLTTVVTYANIAAEDFRSNVMASLVSSLVGFVGLAASVLFDWDLLGLTVALLLSRIVDLGLRKWAFDRYFPTAPPELRPGGWSSLPAEFRSRIWSFCWNSTLLELINVVVWNRSQVLFLERYCNIREVSYYSLGFNLVERVGQFVRMFTGAAGATVMVRYGRDFRAAGRLTGHSVRYAALIALPLLAGAAALSDPFVRVLYGPRYLPAILPFMLQALLSTPKVLLDPVRQLLIAGERQRFLVRWGLLSSAIVLLMNWLLIPEGGAVGASVACGIGQVVAAAGPFWLAMRRYNVVISWRLLGATAGAAAVMGVSAASIGRVQPPYLALAAALSVSVILFLFLLRWTRNLEDQDRERLLQFELQLPASLRPPLRQLIAFLTPRPI